MKACNHCGFEWTYNPTGCPKCGEPEGSSASPCSATPCSQFIRELALRLYSAGYQSGHHNTVEGTFSDDPHGKDADYYHGESVDEIIEDFFANAELSDAKRSDQ